MAALKSSIVAIGIGNTSVQAGLFDQTSDDHQLPIPKWHVVQPSDALQVDPFEGIDLPEDVGLVACASVNRHGLQQMREWIQRRFPEIAVKQLVNHDFPIELGQTEPERVGTDRVAAATAVAALREEGRSAIFVDAGTALTVNAISNEGVFLGGAIMPGIGVSLSTLAQRTDQLPEVQLDQLAATAQTSSIGRNTEAAICSGVFWSAVGAVRELSQRMAVELRGDPQRFVTGGFGEPLAAALGEETRFVPHLVLAGIAIAVRETLA